MTSKQSEALKIKIGIDPDIEKSGFAAYDPKTKKLDLKTMPFFDLLATISNFHVRCDLKVYIESGWLIKKTNWNRKTGVSIGVNEKIAESIGKNHQVGKLITEFCEKNGITHFNVPPRGKIDSATFKRITGYSGRTNQEERDAAMLVYGL